MQDRRYELRRIHIPRTSVNKCHPKRCATQAKAPPERGIPGEQENLPSCTDCWAHSCRRGCPRRLPEPDSSQKMSGLLRPKWLPITELFMGFVVPPSSGSTPTTTPPETTLGPEGTLPERWLALTSMPFVPKSPIPTPRAPEVEPHTRACCP